jgi:hypothetical protein
VPNQYSALSADAQKVIATLWCYQTKLFQEDYTKRWTFFISPQSADFVHFWTGLAELIKSGLVTLNPQNQHVLLTDAGIAFCKKHSIEIEKEKDVYAFK